MGENTGEIFFPPLFSPIISTLNEAIYPPVYMHSVSSNQEAQAHDGLFNRELHLCVQAFEILYLLMHCIIYIHISIYTHSLISIPDDSLFWSALVPILILQQLLFPVLYIIQYFCALISFPLMCQQHFPASLMCSQILMLLFLPLALPLFSFFLFFFVSPRPLTHDPLISPLFCSSFFPPSSSCLRMCSTSLADLANTNMTRGFRQAEPGVHHRTLAHYTQSIQPLLLPSGLFSHSPHLTANAPWHLIGISFTFSLLHHSLPFSLCIHPSCPKLREGTTLIQNNIGRVREEWSD